MYTTTPQKYSKRIELCQYLLQIREEKFAFIH